MQADGGHNGHGSPEDRFSELSALLVGPERTQLADLQRRLDDPATRAQEVGAVLAEAMRLHGRDKSLRKALQGPLEEILAISVRNHPRLLADALFPIFGRAIRNAVVAELHGMMQSFNLALEQSLSWRSVKWRLEGLRTGKPYAEILLLRSLLFRVEQVFLIHRQTGLALLHASAPQAEARDAEMISGMLTAIQDFVRDSFSGEGGDELETARVGPYTLLVAHGPQAILAGVVRGTMTPKLYPVFHDELDAIHVEQAAALAAFKGDTAPFEQSHGHLERCLLGSAEAPRQPSAVAVRFRRALLWAAPALLVAGLCAWWWIGVTQERRWEAYVARVEGEPGIVVTRFGGGRSGHFIEGLRDPLAADPMALLERAGFGRSRVAGHWEPYHSLLPRFVAERSYQDLKGSIESRRIRFRLAKADIPPEQEDAVADLAARLRSLFASAAATGRNVRIEVRGNTDPLGTEKLNTTLARSRADSVAASLALYGVPRERMETRGREAAEPCAAESEAARMACRSASFHVVEVRQGS